jgi:hypothetical protein
MKSWDKYGRLLVKQQDATITVSIANLVGINFAIHNSKLYQFNSSDSLYYEMLASSDQGIVTWYLSDTGITIP